MLGRAHPKTLFYEAAFFGWLNLSGIRYYWHLRMWLAAMRKHGNDKRFSNDFPGPPAFLEHLCGGYGARVTTTTARGSRKAVEGEGILTMEAIGFRVAFTR